ncbi:hypothetical protein BD414DRAFT_498371 [Trametes punicea]|nr:hypothetical protein BD414DRAFT_498371 [Trametes punicea]
MLCFYDRRLQTWLARSPWVPCQLIESDLKDDWPKVRPRDHEALQSVDAFISSVIHASSLRTPFVGHWRVLLGIVAPRIRRDPSRGASNVEVID